MSQDLKMALNKLSVVFNQETSDEKLQIYSEIFSHFPEDEVVGAIKNYLLDPKNKFFPVPAQLIELMRPSVNDEDSAKEVASRITSAITRFGYTNQTEAEEYIGSVGWEVVSLQGGWESICSRVLNRELPTYQAQWRELASVIIKKYKSGDLGPPQLPNKTSYEIAGDEKLLGFQLKKINELEGDA